MREHVLALNVDELPLSLKKCNSLRVKYGGSYGFRIQVIVTTHSLVDRYQSFFFFSLIFGVKKTSTLMTETDISSKGWRSFTKIYEND